MLACLHACVPRTRCFGQARFLDSSIYGTSFSRMRARFADCDPRFPSKVRFYKNQVLTAAQFAAVDTFSCAAYDQLATASSGGQLVFAFTVAKTGSDSQELGTLNITLQAGEILTITAKSSNANDVSATLAWFEDV